MSSNSDDAPAVTTENEQTRRTKISAAAKDALLCFFESQQFGRNDNLPVGTSDPGVSNIMNGHNLNRGQVRRQFAKCLTEGSHLIHRFFF
eukprot:scaffold362094_cov35-Attheya_sp.AAC.1